MTIYLGLLCITLLLSTFWFSEKYRRAKQCADNLNTKNYKLISENQALTKVNLMQKINLSQTIDELKELQRKLNHE